MFQKRFDEFRAMGFDAASAAELATRRVAAPITSHDVRMAHDGSPEHRAYAQRFGCEACRLEAEADPERIS